MIYGDGLPRVLYRMSALVDTNALDSVNPSLTRYGRKDPAPVLPLREEPDLLSWLEASGRLVADEESDSTEVSTVEEEELSALMGEKAAHACTEAVETVIEGHYAGQVEELRAMGEDKLADQFDKFREEEVAHRDLAVEEGAKDAVGYPLLSAAIEAGCRLAIKVSEKI